VDIRVVGAESLGALARDLKAAGEKDLRRELLRGIRKAGEPLKAEARQAALDELPKRNGLAELVADSRWSLQTRTGRNPTVRIRGTGLINKHGQEIDLRSLNRGRLRHPLFGKRGQWYDQAVPVGWFDRAMERAADNGVRKEIVNVIDAVARKLGAGR
jgi:hypothetical protein